MLNINLDTGVKSFSINNDESKVIHFNPTDVNILTRFEKASKEISEFSLKPDEIVDQESASAQLQAIDREVRKQIDFIFDYPVSDVVFGATSPMAPVKGVPYFERFLDAVMPIIEKELKAERKASTARIEKYTERYK